MRLNRLWQSFKNAWRGLVFVFKHEQNFRIQLVIALVTILGAIYFPLKMWEVVLLLMLILLVLVIELLNSAFEYVSDLLKPRLNSYVGAVKDIMAAAVLLTSLSALIIGLMIFVPHFITGWK